MDNPQQSTTVIPSAADIKLEQQRREARLAWRGRSIELAVQASAGKSWDATEIDALAARIFEFLYADAKSIH